MITANCTRCGGAIEADAWGECRCVACGKYQTVTPLIKRQIADLTPDEREAVIDGISRSLAIQADLNRGGTGNV